MVKLVTPIAASTAGLFQLDNGGDVAPVNFIAIAARLAWGILTVPVYGVFTRHFVGSGIVGSSGSHRTLSDARPSPIGRWSTNAMLLTCTGTSIRPAAPPLTFVSSSARERNSREHEVRVALEEVLAAEQRPVRGVAQVDR